MRSAIFALVVALILMFGRMAQAQSTPDANAAVQGMLEPKGSLSLSLATPRQIVVGKRMRAAGIALSVLGAAATAVGGYYLMRGFFGPDDDRSTQFTNGALAGGGVALGLGQAMAAAGIVLWANGQHRVSKAQRVHLTASGSGIGLAF